MSEPERWWIIAPLGHRQYEVENVPETMEFFGQTVPVISVPPPPLDEWICDWCNASIPLELTRDTPDGPESIPMAIPMNVSSALCPKCMQEVLDGEGLRASIKNWSVYFCNCPPCRNGAELVMALERQYR